jgi:LacI family transcriptional regulator
MPKPRRTVALLVETSNAYARGLLEGIIRYIREHRPWSTYLAEHGRGDEPPTWLAGWTGDGIIARIENARIAEAVIASGLPAVDLSAANLVPGLPWVETDDAAIARAAFEHLRERGLRHFAFCGDARFNWSDWRGDHFRRCANEAGYECHVLPSVRPAPRRGNRQSRRARVPGDEWTAETARIAAWLASLPRPVGVMACYDLLGRQVLEACRQLDARVPDEVAVVGVDDDELICELSDPPLSSVAPDTNRTGYEAAALLDRMMSGERVPPREYLVPPLGLVVRESSDVLAVDDADVAAAARYIRDHACDGIDVQDVLTQVPLSRRVLESRFKKLIGRTPHEEIDRVQLGRVRELLRETDLSLSEIARRTGFEHAEYLSVVFKKRIGLPPGEYRRRHRR